MTMQKRTPTEVAKFIVERNTSFENQLQDIKDRFFQALDYLMEDRRKFSAIQTKSKEFTSDNNFEKGFRNC